MEVKVDFSLFTDDPAHQWLRPYIEGGLRDGASLSERITAFKAAHPDANAQARSVYLNCILTGLSAALMQELSPPVAVEAMRAMYENARAAVEFSEEAPAGVTRQ